MSDIRMAYASAFRAPVIGAWEHYEKFAVPPCALAAARALVAGVCVVDLWWRGNTGGTTSLLLAGLGLYGAWCAVIALAVCQRWSSADGCRLLVRCLDVCAIGLLALVDDPFGAPLLLLLSFGFVFASYNGGLRQALTNTLVVIVILAARWAVRPLSYPFGLAVMTGLRHLTVVHPLIIASAGTLFTWSQHRRRAAIEAASATTRLIGSLRPELGIHGVFRAALAELVRLADARAAIVAVEHCGSRQRRLIVLGGSPADGFHVQIRRISRACRATYFFDAAAAARQPRRAQPKQTAATVHVLAAGARRTPIPDQFQAAHPFRRLYGFAFQLTDNWNGRLFLLDPSNRANRHACVRFIGHLLEELVPVVAGVCDLHSLRRRAAAAERARLGRELHDGIVQELVGIDLELELLRHGALGDAEVAGGLEHVQQRLHAELSNLRHLMQRARSYQVDPTRLPQVLHELVERFARESGITARFVCENDRVELPDDVCGELARIVQEALVNVRRHSRARNVLIRFESEGRDWRLSVQDDGCGFQAWVPCPRDAGRPIARQPAVISERVRAIGGSLRLASSIEGGARLEMSSRR